MPFKTVEQLVTEYGLTPEKAKELFAQLEELFAAFAKARARMTTTAPGAPGAMPPMAPPAAGAQAPEPEPQDANALPGGSNIGQYTEEDGPFCGPAGGAPAMTYPVNTIERGRAALSLAHNAPNPDGIKACVYKQWPELKVKDETVPAEEAAGKEKALAGLAATLVQKFSMKPELARKLAEEILEKLLPGPATDQVRYEELRPPSSSGRPPAREVDPWWIFSGIQQTLEPTVLWPIIFPTVGLYVHYRWMKYADPKTFSTFKEYLKYMARSLVNLARKPPRGPGTPESEPGAEHEPVPEPDPEVEPEPVPPPVTPVTPPAPIPPVEYYDPAKKEKEWPWGEELAKLLAGLGITGSSAYTLAKLLSTWGTRATGAAGGIPIGPGQSGPLVTVPSGQGWDPLRGLISWAQKTWGGKTPISNSDELDGALSEVADKLSKRCDIDPKLARDVVDLMFGLPQTPRPGVLEALRFRK